MSHVDRVTLKYTSSIRIELIFHCAFPITFQVAPTKTTIHTTTAPHCPSGWLRCAYSQSQICIKYAWLCDGISNCPDRWDEKPENCPGRFFGESRELKQRQRRPQRERHEFAYLVVKNNSFARPARAFFTFVHFVAVVSKTTT